jgi:integrase
LRLEAGKTKNRSGRLAYLTLELKAGITDQLSRVKDFERTTGMLVPYLFPHLSGLFRGRRITSFRKSWTKACLKAGCPGMLRHELRRTACRNMIHPGIPERVVMTVMGHKTQSMFDRYLTVAPGDLQDLARKLSEQTSYNLGTPDD